MIRSCLQQHHTKARHILSTQLRRYATEKTKQTTTGTSSALSTAQERSDVSTDVKPIGERIKENTKTASYMGVIVLGVTVTGALFYAIFRELWSSNSSNNIYSAALDQCINVMDLYQAQTMYNNIYLLYNKVAPKPK